MSDQSPKPFQFSVLKLLVFVGVLCVVCGVLALVMQGVREAREAVRSRVCVNNLKQIGYVLNKYHDEYGCFPAPFSVDANGKPLHSWRVAIEPLVEDTTFHATFDYSLPWNHPKNLKVSTPFARHFACPSAGNPAGSGFTNYVMIVGQKRRAPSGKEVSFDDHPDAIIVVEIVNSDIYWTEPRELNFDEMSFQINDHSKPSISSHHHAHRALALYADGSVHVLDESTDPDELNKLLTENLEDASGRGKRQP